MTAVGLRASERRSLDPRGLDLPMVNREIARYGLDLPTWTGQTTLTAFLAAEQGRINNNGANKNTFVPLSHTDVAVAAIGIHQILVGDIEAGAETLTILGSETYQFNPTGKSYIIVREPSAPPTGFRGLGTHVFNREPTRAVIVVGTHITTDSGSADSSRRYFVELNAWALYWTGVQRCNSTTLSTCTGTTSICSGGTTAYRISDSNGNNRVMAQAVGMAARNADVDVVLDIHSNGSEIRNLLLGAGGPIGHPAEAETVLVNRVRNALVANPNFTTGSCQSASDPRDDFTFCGTIVPRGRLLNGVTHLASCNTASSAPNSNRWMQIEEQSAVHNNSTNYTAVLDVFKAEIPVRW
jgi:hypothetical protein